MKVAGMVSRGGASVGIFTIDSIAAVGMAVTKSARRAIGSVALFANMLRHGVHKVEDSINNHMAKVNDKKINKKYDERNNIYYSFETTVKTLSEDSQKQFNIITSDIINSSDEKKLSQSIEKYNNFVQSMPEADKKKFSEIEKSAETFIKAQASINFLEPKEKERLAHLGDKRKSS